MEGGGAPNNFTLCFKDLNPSIRKVETRPSPRLMPATSPSKYHGIFILIVFILAPMMLGPGVYEENPATKRMEEKYKSTKIGRKDSNWACKDRFKSL